MYIYLSVIIIFGLYLFFTKEKRAIFRAGKKGEQILYKSIKKNINKGSTIIRNIEFPLYEGSTEIDILVVTPSGIIIVENKHLSGTIYGDKNSQNWTQDKGGSTKEFYNPIKQNNGHYKCLIHNLKKNRMHGINITSIVIFSNEASNIKVSDPFVYDLKGGVSAIKKLSSISGTLDVKDVTSKLKAMAKKYK